MDARRRRYLEAMGVTVWRQRAAAAVGPVAALEGPEGVPDAPDAASLSNHDGSLAPGEARGPGAAGRVLEAPSLVPGMAWDELTAAVVACRACGLCETRTQTVFGVGDREADLMVVGEAPGADEDRQGEPFVGRAGRLLNLMLTAIGLPRERVYIANVLKCRPPGNRDPRPEEALRCEAFLMRQIALVKPRVILSVGRISAQHLLRSDRPIGELRGRWHALGPRRTPLMVTYHPAYLLRSPEAKGKAWSDLLEVVRKLREDPGEPGSAEIAY
jgi:uracil-DNA glycosylase